ncbi:hypothetical protein [Halosimplex pelagicum]|uniref:Substrate-binding domain-containing protein n=1 Tax=Halosimplex pelagicum TaxID=869886 RepID=A0A7D5TFH9_9EURY|nr:hypothetical protein [Halosimplex pelagicum]QLH80396.1 hypothetical protein HZS54_01570 [Halosimplex pelagicum]
MTANDVPDPNRRAVLGSGAALLASLAGCSGLTGTDGADTRTPPDRSTTPSAATDGGPLDPSTSAPTPTATARSVEPLHLQTTGTLRRVVAPLATAWNANLRPSSEAFPVVGPAVADADARLADRFAADRGIEPTGERSRPPFELVTSVSGPARIAADLAAGRIDLGETGPGGVDGLPSADASALTSHVLARDGSAFVVSPAVAAAGVETLSVGTIRGIYEGEIENWSVLGGPDRDIYVVTGASGTPNRPIRDEFFRRAPLDGLDARIGRHRARAAAVADRDDAIADLAVGVVERGPPAVEVTADGTTHGYRDPGYPTTRDVALYASGSPDPREAAVLDALRSPVGQELVRADPRLIAAP